MPGHTRRKKEKKAEQIFPEFGEPAVPDAQSLINSLGFNNQQVFGSVPEAEPFEPIDFDEEQRKALAGSLSSLGDVEQLTDRINNIISEQNRDRVEQLIPGASGQIANNISALLAGRLPGIDVADIISDRAESNAAIGTPGTGRFSATLKDLGLRSLDAQARGQSMFESFLSTVDPIQRRSVPQDFIPSVENRIGTELFQRELDQQSRQSAANLAATPDPAARSLFELAFLSSQQQQQFDPFLSSPF